MSRFTMLPLVIVASVAVGASAQETKGPANPPAKTAPAEPTSPLSAGQPIRATPVEFASSSEVEERLDLVYARYGTRELHLDLFRPKGATDTLPGVLFVHGGGWTAGDKTRFRAMAQALAQRGYVTATIEYRLAGEAKFPAAVHDVNAAIRWLRAHAAQYGVHPEKIAAVGASAGGHLVGLAATAFGVKELQGAGGNAETSSRLQAAVVMAGPFDLTSGLPAERSRKQADSNVNQWLGKTIDEEPELYKLASPMTHLSKDSPEILFQHGELDQPEQNLAARQRLLELGVATRLALYPGGKHGCWNDQPWFDAMLHDLETFLRATLGKEVAGEWRPRLTIEAGEMAFVREGVDLHVTRRKDAVIKIPRMNRYIQGTYLLDSQAEGGGKKIPLALQPGLAEWTVTLPQGLPEGSKAVVRLEANARFVPLTLPEILVWPLHEPRLELPGYLAVTHGQVLRYEPQLNKNTIGYWARQEDWCEWPVYLETAGDFQVILHQGCGQGQGGSKAFVRMADQTLEFDVEDTGHFQNFVERKLGRIRISQPGLYRFEVRAMKKAAGAVMDVRRVTLVRTTPR